MKNVVLLIVSIVFFNSQINAQEFPSKKFYSENVTYLGIDYSHIKLVGSEGFTEPEKIVSYYFRQWNEMIYSEPEKFDIPKFFKKEDISLDLTMVNEMNAQTPVSELVVDNPQTIEASELQGYIEKYNFNVASGLGILFVAENYNKWRNDSQYHMLIIDLEDKSIVFSKKYEAKAMGFGFRNFWLSTFYGTLNQIGKESKSWKKSA